MSIHLDTVPVLSDGQTDGCFKHIALCMHCMVTRDKNDRVSSATYPFGVRRRSEDAVTRPKFWRRRTIFGYEASTVFRVRVIGEVALRHATYFERSVHHPIGVLFCIFLQSVAHLIY